MNKLDKQYIDLVNDILENGNSKKDRTGTGTISVFGRQIRHKMSEGFPILTTKKLFMKGIVTELIWFLRGDTNIKYLVDNNCHIWDGDAFRNYELLMIGNNPDKILNKVDFINKIKTDDKFADKWGQLGPIYGSQWRYWEVDDTDLGDGHKMYIDQIATLIYDIKTNPDSRRLMVNAWNVGELDSMVLPPCHYGFQVYTRELNLEDRNKYYTSHYLGLDETKEKLDDMNIPTRAISLSWNQRSVDVGLGLPFNITSYGLLLKIIAKSVNMVPDELIGNLGDTHLYNNHIEPIKEQLYREPYPLPTLKINSGNENWDLLTIDEIINSLDCDLTFTLENYKSHTTIKLPLSN